MHGLLSAGPHHAAALAQAHAAAFADPLAGPAAWSAEVLELQLGLPGVYALASPGGAFVMARLAADEADILTLAVPPVLQRRGIGRALMEAAMTEAAARGATRMVLEVAETNRPALALYAAAGFVRVGSRRDYYRPGAHAAVLAADLTALARDAG